MASYWFKLAVIQLVMLMAVTSAVNPGMVSRITSSGFGFLGNVGTKKVEEMAIGHAIPPQSGGSGSLSYSVWNMQVNNLQISNSRITTRSSNALGVVISLSLSIVGSYEYSFSFFLSGMGQFDATISDVSSAIYVYISTDESGRPEVTSSSGDCQFYAGQVYVDLHGEWGWISSKAAAHLQDYLNENACDQITGAINNQLEEHLMKLTMLSKIYDGLELDYSLQSNPMITMNNLNIKHKGEVYAIGNHSEAPAGPIATIPEDFDDSNMFYVWITDYLVNSLTYVLHNNGYLQHNVTQDDVPEGIKVSLNTSGFPLSTVFPQVRKKYPNKMTQFYVKSTKQPVINTTCEKLTVNIYGDVEAYVINEPDTLEYMFTLGTQLTVSFRIAMKGQNVTWVSKVESVKLDVVKTAIGDVKIDLLKAFLPAVIKNYLNKMGFVGRPIPAFQDYHPTATNITQGMGFLKIGTSLRLYNPVEETFEDLFRALIFH